MGVTGHKGIDVRQSGTRLIFDALMLDSAGAVVISATTLRLCELQDDGTLLTFEWAAGADQYKFIASASTKTASMTHRTSSSDNTGIHTYVLSSLTYFTAGAIYYAIAYNASASPPIQVRKFQYGSGVLADTVQINGLNADGTSASRPTLELAQLRCVCSAANEGAIHCLNQSGSGYGQYNTGPVCGQLNSGSVGQDNSGSSGTGGIGQYNHGETGQSNAGSVADIFCGGTGTIFSDSLAPIRVDFIDAPNSTALGAIADAIHDEALAGHTTPGTAGAAISDILEDTGTTLPGLIPSAATIASTVAGQATGNVAGSIGKGIADILALFAGITSVAAWLRGMFRKSAMNSTAKSEVNTGGGTFDEATDSLEAIRDKADLLSTAKNITTEEISIVTNE